MLTKLFSDLYLVKFLDIQNRFFRVRTRYSVASVLLC